MPATAHSFSGEADSTLLVLDSHIRTRFADSKTWLHERCWSIANFDILPNRFPLAGDRDTALATTVDDRRQGKGATLSPMRPESSRSHACKITPRIRVLTA